MKPEKEIQVRRWECYTPPQDDLPSEKGCQEFLSQVQEMGKGASSRVRRSLIVLLAVVMFLQLLLEPGRVEFYVHLLAGWGFFAWQSLSLMRLDMVAIANGLIGVAVACAVLHWLLVKCFGKTEASPEPWQWKWTLLIAMMVATMFGVCVATVGLVTSIGWANKRTSVTTLGTTRQQSRSNAKSLVVYARYDAKQRNGRIPDERPGVYGGVQDVYGQFYLEDLSQPPEPFIWLGAGLNVATTPGDVPIAAAPQKYADGLRLVAFMDESTKKCTEEEWQAALVRWRQVVADIDRKTEVK